MMGLWMMTAPKATAGIQVKDIPVASMGMELTQLALVIKMVGLTQPVLTTIQPPVTIHFILQQSHGSC